MASEGVEVETRPAQPVVSVRSVVAIGDLGRSHGEKMEAIAGYLRSNGLQPVGPPFVRYHTFGEHDTDVEVGVPLASAPDAGDGELRPGLLPGGMVLRTSHAGADDRLGEAYARVAAAVRDGGYAAAGPAWEVYHWLDLGSGNAAEPGRRVELVQPVATRGKPPAG